jgi:hypothetical protein
MRLECRFLFLGLQSVVEFSKNYILNFEISCIKFPQTRPLPQLFPDQLENLNQVAQNIHGDAWYN